MRLQLSRHILEKYSNVKFHKNPSSGSRAVGCGLTDSHDEVVAFRNLANAPKISFVSQDRCALLHSHVVTLWEYE